MQVNDFIGSKLRGEQMDADCVCGHLAHLDEDCPEQVRLGGELFPCGCDDYVPSRFDQCNPECASYHPPQSFCCALQTGHDGEHVPPLG